MGCGTAPPKPTPHGQLVDLTLLRLQARCLRSGRQRGFTVLRAGPDLAALWCAIRAQGHPRGGAHRLHRGVVLEGIAVCGLNPACTLSEDLHGLALAPAINGGLRCQATSHQGVNVRLLKLGIGPALPLDGQCVQRLLGAPPGVGHHGYRVGAHRQHPLDARHAQHRLRLKGPQRATKHRTGLDGRMQHTRQDQVAAVHETARGLVHCVEPGQGLASEAPLAGVLEGRLVRDGQSCGLRCQLTVTCTPR